MGELIAECIVSGAEWEFVPHQVDDGRSRGNEEDFHASVVRAHKIHEKVYIAHAEYKQIHFLCLARNA